MIRWFAKNDIAANLLLVAILLAGTWVASTKVPLQVSPSYEWNTVIASMNYKGGTAQDVEQSIVIPIEQAIADIGGIKRIWAKARRGRGFVWMELEDNADLQAVLEEVKSRVERIRTFPGETEEPEIRIPNSDSYRDILGIAITGNLTEQDLFATAERIRDDLVAMNGISHADIEGSRPAQITIEVDKATLHAYDLSFEDISSAIRRSSIDLPAGRISGKSGSLSVRTLGQAYSVDDFANIPIRSSNGANLLIGEIATITDGYESGRVLTRFNGEPGMIVRVMRRDQESAITISDLVTEYAATASERFPEGISLHVWDDESTAIRSRLGTLVTSLLQGCVLVFIVLALFLRPSIAFWTVIGIPVSFAGGILLMPVFGVSANLMSIFGFIIVVGLVVDDAIVTGENIYTKLQEGLDPLDAAVVGTKEVATPVTFGIITTIVAFLPLLYFSGHWGTLAKQIPVIVAPVLIFSLIESKLILPSHLKHVRTGRQELGRFARFQRAISNGLERLITRFYQPSLNFALKHRYAVCAGFLALAVVMTGLFQGGKMKFITVPSVERNIILANINLPTGTRIEQTEQYIDRIGAAAHLLKQEYRDGDRSLIVNIFEEAGERERDGSLDENEGRVLVELRVPSQRTEPGPTTSEVAERWKELVGDIPEARRLWHPRGKNPATAARWK